MSENDEAPDGPLDAEGARQQILRDYVLPQEKAAKTSETGPVESIIIPPRPEHPDPGFVWVRIKVGFPVHEFNITQLELQLTQTDWTDVPAEQLAEINQFAAENQVLLEVVEAPAEA